MTNYPKGKKTATIRIVLNADKEEIVNIINTITKLNTDIVRFDWFYKEDD